MNLIKLVNRIAEGVGASSARRKPGALDLGILKVAMMVAALDGKVLDAEYKAYLNLAIRGFGLPRKAAVDSLVESMRAGGYLMLVAMKVGTRTLVKEFIAEACRALPAGFIRLPIADIRRAVITWTAMAISDGEYSDRERACIEAIRRHFAQAKAALIERENAYWMSQPAQCRSLAEDHPGSGHQLVDKNFMEKVESLVTTFGGSAEACKALDNLIAKGA